MGRVQGAGRNDQGKAGGIDNLTQLREAKGCDKTKDNSIKSKVIYIINEDIKINFSIVWYSMARYNIVLPEQPS
jgi:hypothetical protein